MGTVEVEISPRYRSPAVGVPWPHRALPLGAGGGSAATAAFSTLLRTFMLSTFESTGTASLLRVLLVDARPERRELIRHLVEGTGLADTDVGEAGSGAEAVELLDQADRDVAVVEIQMPVDKGLETIAALRRRSPALRIVVCSFHSDPVTKELALGGGADVYLDKPVSSDTFKSVLREFFPEAPTVPDARPQEQPQPTGG
jgi:two-component system, chemotaxis family, chemotaxis protein CheY